MKLKKQCLRAVSGVLAASVMAAMVLTSCGGTNPPASSSQPTSSSTSTSQPSSSSTSGSSVSSTPDSNQVKWNYVPYGENAILMDYDPKYKEPDRVITLPDKVDGYRVTGIMVNTFSGSKFKEVTIPASIKDIGLSAFEGSTNLTKVTILGASKIKQSTFSRCSNLESVSLNNEITEIGGSAFDGCYKLKTVNMPTNLKKIERDAFRSTKLEGSLVIPKNVTYIGDEAFADTAITDIIIPESAKKIGEGAFKATKLFSVILPEGLTEIESKMFERCYQLKNVYIPASVKYIDSDAFYSCNNVEVYYGGSEAAWNQIDIATGNDKLASAVKYFGAKSTDLSF